MRVTLFWKVQQRVSRVEVLLASLAIGEAFDLHFTKDSGQGPSVSGFNAPA
jgi:hypothetical protein